MLVGRCSSELSGHQNLKEIKQVTTSERSRGPCSFTQPTNQCSQFKMAPDGVERTAGPSTPLRFGRDDKVWGGDLP